MKEKVVNAAIVAVIAATAGVLTAPFAVPVVNGALAHKMPNATFVTNILQSPDAPGAYLAAVATTTASESMRAAYATWIGIVFTVIVLYLAYKHAVTPARVVGGDSPLGNAAIVSGWNALKRKNDFWSGQDKPKHASHAPWATSALSSTLTATQGQAASIPSTSSPNMPNTA